jgi:RNA polymerase sigma-70 factor (ECF subfamily)
MQHRPFPFTGALASIVGVSDEPAFAILLERHRAELHGHCLRMLRSPADAEDALQETLLRAWRSRRTFASGAARPWLYRIATNACFDLSARRGPQLASLDDELADQEPAGPPDERPDAIVLAQETLELALLAASQQLPPRQHAARAPGCGRGSPPTVSSGRAPRPARGSARSCAAACRRWRDDRSSPATGAAAGASAALPVHGRGRAARPIGVNRC